MNRTAAVLIKSAAWMTALSFLNKLLGVFLRLYVSARAGSAGMGLFTLVLSVYTLFSTFATAGFTLAVSRLAAEKRDSGEAGARRITVCACRAALLLSAAACAAMLAFADPAAKTLLGDERCAAPLRVLAASLPFMAFAACLKGWLFSLRKGVVTAAASLLEQAVKTAVTAVMLGFVFAGTNDLGDMCLGMALAITVSESASCAFLFIKSALWRKSCGKAGMPPRAARRELFSVAFPVALSVWITSLLHTAESLLVPKVFASYSGGSREYALSQFGMIRGMVIPLLFFPFVFLASLISVFTPELSRLNLLADRAPLRARVKLLTGAAAVFAFAAGGVFFALPEYIGEAFYPGADTAGAVRILALVTPFMYIETVCDGVLKAVGEQKRTLGYTVLNSALRLALIFTLVKRYGGEGYLWLLVVSNTFSYVLCRVRLWRVTGAGANLLHGCVIPVLCAAGAGAASRYALRFLAGKSCSVCAAAGTVVYAAVFALLLLLFSGNRVRNAVSAFAKRGAERACGESP